MLNIYLLVLYNNTLLYEINNTLLYQIKHTHRLTSYNTKYETVTCEKSS